MTAADYLARKAIQDQIMSMLEAAEDLAKAVDMLRQIHDQRWPTGARRRKARKE